MARKVIAAMTTPAKPFSALCAALALMLASPAHAGAPYATDDPAPTDPGHWEIYSFVDDSIDGGEHSGKFGLDLSYGAADDVQISALLPFEFDSASGESSRFGDVEVGVKLRLVDDQANHRSLAVFPRVILPTSSGSGKASYLLPVWVQQDFGNWSVYGGGGYLIHPGTGNRDAWQQGITVTNQLSDGLQLGAELFHKGADANGEHGATAIRAGAIVGLAGPFSLTISAGPLIEDGTDSTSFSGFAAILTEF